MSESFVSAALQPVRELPPPLGLFFRPGFNHNHDLAETLASGHRAFHGAVFGASIFKRQHSLLESVRSIGLDAVLDPETQLLATLGGFTESRSQLPWANENPHKPSDLRGVEADRMIESIVEWVTNRGFTGVLTPTHLLEFPGDPWFDIDCDLCTRLRLALDAAGQQDVNIFYSLALPLRDFRRPEIRRQLLTGLESLPLDSIWLRVSNFGKDATGPAFEAYLEGAREFCELQVPIISENVGGLIGLGLLAFGGAGGICHGITEQEQFNTSHWLHERSGGGGGNSKRVYIPNLDLYFSLDQAEQLFSARGAKSRFACLDTSICPNGPTDMMDQPGRYFVAQRMKQVAFLSQVPQTLRPDEFVERFVRPLTDYAVFSTSIDAGDPKLKKRLEKNRKRLDRLRPAFGALAERASNLPFARVPRVRATREI